MTVDDKIKDEKLQYNIKRDAAQIPVFSSVKIDKYEYLTGEVFYILLFISLLKECIASAYYCL